MRKSLNFFLYSFLSTTLFSTSLMAMMGEEDRGSSHTAAASACSAPEDNKKKVDFPEALKNLKAKVDTFSADSRDAEQRLRTLYRAHEILKNSAPILTEALEGNFKAQADALARTFKSGRLEIIQTSDELSELYIVRMNETSDPETLNHLEQLIRALPVRLLADLSKLDQDQKKAIDELAQRHIDSSSQFMDQHNSYVEQILEQQERLKDIAEKMGLSRESLSTASSQR